MPTTNTRSRKRVTTTDITGPLTITDKVVISMIQQLAKSYRKDPQTSVSYTHLRAHET